MGRQKVNLAIVLAAVAACALIVVTNGLTTRSASQADPSEGQETADADAAGVRAEATARATRLDVPDVAPQTPWLKPSPEQILTRIAVGSCLSQRHPKPILDALIGLDPLPQAFLMIGDNVYGDIRSEDGRELVEAYREQGRDPALAAVRAKVPVLATWDDHDYGANDAGAEFEHKAFAAKLFYSYWQKEPLRDFDAGIYDAQVFGPPGRRVQIILLDTRSFRSPLKKAGVDFPYWGRYEPSTAPALTILGEAQWSWLRTQLQAPADLRLIVSSVQVMAKGHGYERWGNVPAEEERLFDLIQETSAGGIVLLSGDRHFAAFYRRRLGDGQVIPEMTASSFNRSYGPSKDGPSPERVGGMFHQENFGLVDIDWEARTLAMAIIGIGGEELARETYKFDDLAVR